MSNIFYELILWMPALVIFPLTRLIQVYTSFCDAHLNSHYLMSSRYKFPGNNKRIVDLKNNNKITSGHSVYETAVRRDG